MDEEALEPLLPCHHAILATSILNESNWRVLGSNKNPLPPADGADSGGDVDEEALELLLEQGACRADGILALRHCHGDPDAALDFLVDCFATKVSAAERLATAEAECAAPSLETRVDMLHAAAHPSF